MGQIRGNQRLHILTNTTQHHLSALSENVGGAAFICDKQHWPVTFEV